jgi:hypothetical protein
MQLDSFFNLIPQFLFLAFLKRSKTSGLNKTLRYVVHIRILYNYIDFLNIYKNQLSCGIEFKEVCAETCAKRIPKVKKNEKDFWVAD